MKEIEDIITEISPYYAAKKKRGQDISVLKHYLVYDSSTETLEPVYFWILDFMNGMFGGKVEKLIDNFASSPGGGHFSEIQGKVSQMQQEASRVLGTVNNILKGVLNLIYDLKEFKLRLSHYDAANAKDKTTAEAGLLALKQIWMDKIDIQRGQGSLNAMTAGDLNFITLRDAFLATESVDSVNKLDLNERVKRVLKPRLQEFFDWRTRSEQELRKRYEIEKLYLKSQVNALKLNARWAKPYLEAAQKLAGSEKLAGSAALVNIFNTLVLELAIMGKNPLNVKKKVIAEQLPENFKNIKNLRNYNSISIIDFRFRGIPSKTGQHYTFGGRVDAHFNAYALTDDELLLLQDKLSESDLDDSLKLVQGMTDDSLAQLKIDLDELLEEKPEKEKEAEDTNPFTSLFKGFTLIPKKIEESKEDKLKRLKKKQKPETYAEKYLRKVAEMDAADNCFDIYDKYKKGHGMATIVYGGGSEELDTSPPKVAGEELFGL